MPHGLCLLICLHNVKAADLSTSDFTPPLPSRSPQNSFAMSTIPPEQLAAMEAGAAQFFSRDKGASIMPLHSA